MSTAQSWLKSFPLLVALCLPCCIGGQTGDPSALCGGWTASQVLDQFEGAYQSPVVFSRAPVECPAAADATLHVDISSDLHARKVRPDGCSVWVPVLVQQTLDAETPTTAPGWLNSRGLVRLGERPDAAGVAAEQLRLDARLRKVSLSSDELSTVEDCCFVSFECPAPG